MPEDRAVSNVLGYVLLFSVVLLSITATFTFGLDALEQAQGDNVRESGEQAIVMTGGQIEQLRESNTTIRRSQVRTRRGTIGNGEQTTITVSVGGTQQLQTDFRPLIYEFDGTTIAYEGGAVVRTNDDGGGVLVEEPSFVLEDDAVVLPVVSTEPENRRRISGSAVTVELTRMESTQQYYGTEGEDVEIEIDTTANRAAVWERTLTEQGASCTRTGTGSTVECDYDPSASDATVIVREFRVGFGFET